MNVPLPGVLVGPALTAGAELFSEVYQTMHRLFGQGNPPERPDVPDAPPMNQGTSKDEEGKAHDENQKGAGDLAKGAEKGKKHGKDAAEGAQDDKKKLEALWKEHEKNAQTTANGGTTETDNSTTQAMRDGLRDMRNLVSGAADNSAMRAGGLPMPSLGGLNPLGMGGGMNPLGGGMLGGGQPGGGMGAAGGLPFGMGAGTDPNAAAHQGHVPNPLDNALNPPDSPANPPAGNPPDHPAPGTPADHSGPGNDHNSTGHAIIADPAATNSREVVTGDGKEKTTAPDDVSAAVLRHALANPNTPNMAEAAYAAAGITLPGNGADPGKVVGIGEIVPGDIVRLADHDAIVWGNGKVLNPDGTTQPIDQAINASTLKGIFHVARSLSAGSPSSGTATSVSNPKPETPTAATHPANTDENDG